ncbi:MAG: Zn-ribbon domain-containing OB-fold protein [Desulfobacterales bacterium]|nr:Zn-ribbon domain-containing OB-fold protein [Desulfobacterales bacterium]
MNPSQPIKPIVNPCAQPFWDATRQGKLMIQHCRQCSAHVFYPRLYCPECHSDRLSWTEIAGRGTVYSFTVVRNNAPSAFLAAMPYVVAIVRLEEGVQMCTNIVGCDPEEVRCDMPVEVVFDKIDDEFTLPRFKPAT